MRATPRGRLVSIVLIDGGGVRGITDEFEVESPWWVDIEPISLRHPGLVVLRLLEGRPAPGHVVGGSVTYLAEWSSASGGATGSLGRLRDWDGELPGDPLRLPWAAPGGPEEDLDWVRGHVGGAGTPVQHRTWNLSSIWSLPTDRGTVWLKCVPPFLGHEARVLRFLEGWPVPRLLADDGHRMLFEALPGENAYEAPVEVRASLIDLLVSLERTTAAQVDDLLELGVPDRRWSELLRLATDVVERRAPSNAALHRLLDDADMRIRAIDDCGLPDVLVHGDAHGGNARFGPGAGPGIWFDWGDSRVGHPLLDVAVLERANATHADALMAHWLGAWATACPGSDPQRAWELIRPLAALGDAVVYQGFLDRIEQSERIYHEVDVPECLDRAAVLAGTSRPSNA